MPTQIFGRKQNRNEAHVKISTMDNELSCFPNLNFANPREFSPKWNLAEGEIFFIELTTEEDLSLIKPYIDSSVSSVNINPVSKQDFPKISAVYATTEVSPGVYKIKFQRIWNKNYFKKSTMQFLDDSSECIISENKTLIILTGKTDAYWDGEEHRLYFEKFRDIKGMFEGIDKFYREATREDLNKFSAVPILSVNSSSSFGARALNKIAVMVDDDIFQGKSVSQLKSYADKYGQEFPEIENEKIKIESNKDIETIYKIVNEMFYTSEICNEKREINSYEKIV